MIRNGKNDFNHLFRIWFGPRWGTLYFQYFLFNSVSLLLMWVYYWRKVLAARHMYIKVGGIAAIIGLTCYFLHQLRWGWGLDIIIIIDNNNVIGGVRL